MRTKTLKWTTLGTMTLALAGCSILGSEFTTESVKYEESSTRGTLEIPPDLANVERNKRFDVPTRPQVASANQEAARQKALGVYEAQTGDILPKTIKATIMREGNERWVRTDVPAEELWEVVQTFWSTVGLVVKYQDPKTGIIVTEWAENKADLPQDIIRKSLGKVLDFVYSTGERDQYRCRIERNPDGSSDIFIVNRKMVEVVKGKESESTMWQPGASDPTLEVAMLQRLAQRIDAEFNPMLKTAKERTQDRPVIEVKKDVLATGINGDDGQLNAIEMTAPYDRAWREISLLVDRTGFELIDRDRVAGYFLITYLDPQYEKEEKNKEGFFSGMFSKSKGIEAPTYRIYLSDEGDKTRVSVLNKDGDKDPTGVAPRILTLMLEQLH